MLKWFKVAKRNRKEIVWDGKIVGCGTPQVFVNVIQTKNEPLPKPIIPRKLFEPRGKL